MNGASVNGLIVRRERPEDRAAARAVQAEAFGADGAEPVEARLLDALRMDGWIPELSLVAVADGRVVGHNVCTRGWVASSSGDIACVGLGPIGVDPGQQRSGVGSALMWAMIGAADALGEPLIALLGSPDYYRRFGFVASSELAIEPPDAAWGDFFQVLTLTAWSDDVRGRFRYAAPFDELD